MNFEPPAVRVTSREVDVEVFATGLRMGESPRWHDGRLWVCDWVAGEVLPYDAAATRESRLPMTGLPFSVDWLPDGRTVLTTNDGVRGGPSSRRTARRGQAWNEIVVDPAGRVSSTCPGST